MIDKVTQDKIYAACRNHNILIDKGIGLTKIGPNTIMVYGVKLTPGTRRYGGLRQVRFVCVTGSDTITVECYEN